MTLLAPTQWNRARDYIFTHGRDLDQARFGFLFEDGSAEAVQEALSEFQNSDGGFGNALEPDFRLPQSSVLATTVGLQILRECKTPSDHRLVSGALAYLRQAFDPLSMVWPIIPPHRSEAPHAPWWAYGSDVARTWKGFAVNPRVEIVGYLWEHDHGGFPDWVREELTKAVVSHAEERTDEIEMFDLLCYGRLMATAPLPDDVRESLRTTLLPRAAGQVETDPEKWSDYVLAPLELVDSPDSPYHGIIPEAVAAHLDHEIADQGEDGGWHPKWSWFGSFDEDWPAAERDWAGVITLRTLQTLQAFGRTG